MRSSIWQVSPWRSAGPQPRAKESCAAASRVRALWWQPCARKPPQVLISASAVGYYGSRGDEILTEAAPAADDFLGRVAAAWEEEALAAEPLGVRVARLRIGMVVGPNGGALARMLPPFRLGVGGTARQRTPVDVVDPHP